MATLVVSTYIQNTTPFALNTDAQDNNEIFSDIPKQEDTDLTEWQVTHGSSGSTEVTLAVRITSPAYGSVFTSEWIEVTWVVQGTAAYYKVYLNGELLGTTLDTFFEVLTPNTDFEIMVIAYGYDGEMAWDIIEFEKIGEDTWDFPDRSSDNPNHESVNITEIDIIDESKPLKIWVKLENDNWYSSENLTDLSLVDPSNIKYYIIETPYGYVGYYTDETDADFGHCPIIYSPLLENGTIFKEPVGGMLLKLWVRAAGQWYYRYITDRTLGYDYRQYMTWEVIDDNTWQLGFNITGMEFTVGAATRQFDIYVGIRVHQDSKNVDIKQQVTPYNDYEDIALEWQCLTAPNFVGTDLELSYVHAFNDTWSRDFALSQFYDVTTEIPDYVSQVELLGANNVTYHTFNFEDLSQYGLDGLELFRVENMTLPNGAEQHVCRIGATKGESIAAFETLDIDPTLSISDETGYYLITTNTYTIRIGKDDQAGIDRLVINGHDTLPYEWEWQAKISAWNTTNDVQEKWRESFDSPSFTITGNNTWRIVIEAYEDVVYDTLSPSLTLRYNVTWVLYDDFILYNQTYTALSGAWQNLRLEQGVERYGDIGTDGYGDVSGYWNGTHWTRFEGTGYKSIPANWQALMIWDNNSYSEIYAPLQIEETMQGTQSWYFRPDWSGTLAAHMLPYGSGVQTVSAGDMVGVSLAFVILDEGGNQDDIDTVGANVLPFYEMLHLLLPLLYLTNILRLLTTRYY